MRERLLKRLSRISIMESTEVSELDVNDLIASIQDDVEKLFNTRHGTVLINDSFGLPDFSQLMNGYAEPDVDYIRRALTDALRSFEPRLAAVEVSPAKKKEDLDVLRFVLNASFNYKQQDLPFSVNVLLHDDGSVSLE